MSEPIVLPQLWRTVMRAAGFRCQCTGECGSAHQKSKGRCPREHDQYASKHRGPIHLTAAPVDPTTPPVKAVQLPPSHLRAWCPDCHDGVRLTSHRTASVTPDLDQYLLFDL